MEMTTGDDDDLLRSEFWKDDWAAPGDGPRLAYGMHGDVSEKPLRGISCSGPLRERTPIRK